MGEVGDITPVPLPLWDCCRDVTGILLQVSWTIKPTKKPQGLENLVILFTGTRYLEALSLSLIRSTFFFFFFFFFFWGGGGGGVCLPVSLTSHLEP